MAIKLVREFNQSQQLSITPQLKKSIDLLQLSRLEIINKINNEIEDNPFLKKDEKKISDSGFDDMEILKNLASTHTLQTHLEEQLEDLRLSAAEKRIATIIIQSLEENGLLQLDIHDIEEMMKFEHPKDEINNVLINVIQNLEPAGVGARNFKETIYIQLRKKGLSQDELDIANHILFNPEFTNFEDAKTDLALKFPEILIIGVLEKIKKCDLSPGLEFEPINIIQPDLEIVPNNDHDFDVKFKMNDFPLITIDKELEGLVKDKKNKANKELKEKMVDAKWLIRAINKRNETVQNVGTFICKMQGDFLLDISSELRPINNIEIAKELKISASTVSRILRSKYIQTPKGAVSMKSLLVNSVSKTRKVTPMQLMEVIQKIIEDEPKKLSDQKISDMLNLRGYNLARRTIAKYRKKVDIPSSRNR